MNLGDPSVEQHFVGKDPKVGVLTVKAGRDIASPRVVKREQASANRWYLEVKLTAPADVDRELTSWLVEAYELSA